MKEFLIIDINKIITVKLSEIVDKLINSGATVYLVGGALRDLYYNLPVNDFDLEVYDLSFEKLKELLKDESIYVNDKFCTIKLNKIEIALPRREEKVGYSYLDYQLTFNNIKPEEAVQRRDFTINTLMYNFNKQTYEDYTSAFEDLKNNRLCLVNQKHFSEDSIRTLRLLKYQSKLGLKIDQETFKQAKEMAIYLKQQPNDLVIQLFKQIIAFDHLNLDDFFEILTLFFNFNNYDEIKRVLHYLLKIKTKIDKKSYYLVFITLLFTHASTDLNSDDKLKLFNELQPFLMNKEKDIELVKNLINDVTLFKAYQEDFQTRKLLKNKYQNKIDILLNIALVDYLYDLESKDIDTDIIWFENNIKVL